MILLYGAPRGGDDEDEKEDEHDDDDDDDEEEEDELPHLHHRPPKTRACAAPSGICAPKWVPAPGSSS